MRCEYLIGLRSINNNVKVEEKEGRGYHILYHILARIGMSVI